MCVCFSDLSIRIVANGLYRVVRYLQDRSLPRNRGWSGQPGFRTRSMGVELYFMFIYFITVELV